MWSSERQQCQVVRALLRRVRLERLWTGQGPTQEAIELLDDGGGALSHGEAIMLRVAFDLWNGSGEATVGDVLSVLDSGNLHAVGSLLVELSHGRPNVDEWVRSLAGAAP